MAASTITSGGETPASVAEAQEGRQFRPDIEGLRAVAVVVVLAFHAGVPGFGGGFVGVDVFLVISGFLITGHLLRPSASPRGPSSARVLRPSGPADPARRDPRHHRHARRGAGAAAGALPAADGDRRPFRLAVRLQPQVRVDHQLLPAGPAAVAVPAVLVAVAGGAVLPLVAGAGDRAPLPRRAVLPVRPSVGCRHPRRRGDRRDLVRDLVLGREQRPAGSATSPSPPGRGSSSPEGCSPPWRCGPTGWA